MIYIYEFFYVAKKTDFINFIFKNGFHINSKVLFIA